MSSSQQYSSTKPYTRWWWFNGPIREEDVRYQLDWLKQNGFGGVEIAFLYSQPGSVPGPEWLSPQWSQAVAYAKRYAERIGLGCDFTFGSAWPFGGSVVAEADASRTFAGLSRQLLEKSWETPRGRSPDSETLDPDRNLEFRTSGLGFAISERGRPLYVLNHLDRHALERYSQKMGAALKDALAGETSALFCDSFEVDPEGLWSDGLDRAFLDRFEREVDPDGTLDPAERAKRTEHARKAYFLSLALKSSMKRSGRGRKPDQTS